MPGHRFTTVLFDLDGTLVHSAPDLHLAANQLLANWNRPGLTLAQVMQMVGEGAAKLVERAFAATGGLPEYNDGLNGLTRQFLDIYELAPAALSKPWDGVVPQLERLQAEGIKMGVCTNKPHTPTLTMLETLNLSSYFDAVIGGDSLPVKKPDAAPVLACLEQLGGNIKDAVLVGDSPNDVGAARNAGIASVCVSFGYRRVSARDLHADALIDHFDELPKALATLSP